MISWDREELTGLYAVYKIYFLKSVGKIVFDLEHMPLKYKIHLYVI